MAGAAVDLADSVLPWDVVLFPQMLDLIEHSHALVFAAGKIVNTEGTWELAGEESRTLPSQIEPYAAAGEQAARARVLELVEEAEQVVVVFGFARDYAAERMHLAVMSQDVVGVNFAVVVAAAADVAVARIDYNLKEMAFPASVLVGSGQKSLPGPRGSAKHFHQLLLQ